MIDNLSEPKVDSDSEIMDFLHQLIKKGGPEPLDYTRFINIVENLDMTKIDDLRYVLNQALNEETLMGHGFIKPYGYPGDFRLIDKIYEFKINEDPRYRNWDIFFQNQPGAKAVRNRKDYFIKYCNNLIEETVNPRVLILGSGPAADVYDFMKNGPQKKNIFFDLIDFDQSAIDYSREKNKDFNDQISYYRINALRYNSLKSYDLIWSAGLFDYFKDKHFTFLIRKYFNCLEKDGKMVISNFSTRNPTRKLMERVIDWNLNLRTESDLYRIASEAGIDKELVSIEKEPLEINLFLVIRKNL